MEFEIKKGVPLPKPRGKPRKYNIPLEEMEVGDMVEVWIPKTKIRNENKIIRNLVLRYTHRNPKKKFTVRQLDDVNGIGIWRIE